ncbi:hypothetical protein BAX96_11965 [Elizabethkingia anophelis]|uniref:Uncharacterized protein n=2 Tax=Weeksellaceae TaxID=2762318 RepID=A0A1T3E3G0_9FLAO|nr:hypothetical protein AYC67_10580 [Elizabethkingia anophelis]ASV78764.1 hypothetical protein A6J37_09120 [Elizabethkingia anophelis]KUF41425.1 hypothetical protein AS358_00815 [Elizabethkingia anophelis]MDV2460434.1 hypothetical protein [Elizabethkingia anophelis]MDV2492978.1 hypothetical protein [Elizabethkingia anophelis]
MKHQFMKKLFLLFFILLIKSHSLQAQQKSVFNPKINKDSLYSTLEYLVPEGERLKYREILREADDSGKDYILIVLYNLQKGGKDYLINNFESHKTQIMKLRSYYENLNFNKYIVTVSHGENPLFLPSSYIKISIDKIKEGYLNDEILDRRENLEYIKQYSGENENSSEIKEALAFLKWDTKTLTELKALIKEANVKSIRNGNPTQIEVHPNLSAMYSYKIYRENLNRQQIIEYNDGCNYIHYKDNIVLHNGAPEGVLCFER